MVLVWSRATLLRQGNTVELLPTGCWHFVDHFFLSTYLLSPTQPSNSQGSLPNHPHSSLTCSLNAWETGLRGQSRMLTRGDIRGWKRGHRRNRKRCVGYKELLSCTRTPWGFLKAVGCLSFVSHVMETGLCGEGGCSHGCRLGLSPLANRNTWYPVDSELRIKHNFFF